jgi:hypothetical protein
MINRYRLPQEPDADESGGPSDQDVDNRNLPPVLPNQGFMPNRDGPIYDANNGDEQARQQWLEDNVFSQGWTVDGATGEIYDPETDTVKGTVPSFYPRT